VIYNNYIDVFYSRQKHLLVEYLSVKR